MSFQKTRTRRSSIPIAVTAGAKNPVAAEAFISYLKTPEGQAAFTKQGFTILK